MTDIDFNNLSELNTGIGFEENLRFYKEDGNEAKYELKEDGITHQLEFVKAEENLNGNPKFIDPKKGPLIKFIFKDLENNKEVVMSRQMKSGFFRGMAQIKPQPSERMQIKRIGHGFDTRYEIAKL